MALYAFDGTWNSDEDDPKVDTNVVRFAELYQGKEVEYVAGVGTRFGKIGAILGGLFGSGGRTRISEMYDELCSNWQAGDREIDIIGFSRGAALAVHFANKVGKEGIVLADGSHDETAKVRFLGIWDLVGSFGLSLDTFVDFQSINLGWDIDTLDTCVENGFHAMALDERRETFKVTRLNPQCDRATIREVWFRGVHSDVGGGNGTIARSNIALQWMLDQARSCGLRFDEEKAKKPRYSKTDRFAPIYQNKDVKLDERREVTKKDTVHSSAEPLDLKVGESHQCKVLAESMYNWSGVRVHAGGRYTCTVAAGDTWTDGDMDPCDADGWRSEDLPWYKEEIVEFVERFRRLEKANWFALIGALDDKDNDLFLIGNSTNPFQPGKHADLYLFANDMPSKYDNNEGALIVNISRVG